MRERTERVIYDNYDIYDTYREDAIEWFKELNNNREPTENEIESYCRDLDYDAWQTGKDELRKFFQDGDLWLLTGTMRLWDGDSQFNFVFQTFDEMLNRVGKDCDYFKFWDENGHFFIKCSHHDGTNYGEIKYITPKGKRLIENWGSTYSKRYDFSARELYERIYKRYSTFPNYANKIYGCQKIEYKNVDKGE